MSDTAALRQDLATCTRILAMKGLIGLFGHVSAFDSGSGQVFLSPGAGVDKGLTQAEDLFVFGLEGDILKRGQGVVPLEWPIHLAVHAARSDALAVAHLHAPFSTLFAVAQREFKPVTGKRLAELLGDRTGALLRGHGSGVVGAEVQEVLLTSLILEDKCAVPGRLQPWATSSRGRRSNARKVRSAAHPS